MMILKNCTNSHYQIRNRINDSIGISGESLIQEGSAYWKMK